MPLVIICGLPCSGKTSLARRLAECLRAADCGKPVEVVSEEDHGANRALTHDTCHLEKAARSSFLSTIERRLSRDLIVIADGLNYIKGFRYQLYCVARAAGTPHCVLYCQASVDTVRARNRQLARYPLATVDELVSRWEEPSYTARWDAPLFTTDERGEGVDWTAIRETLLGRVARPPSMATAAAMRTTPLGSANDGLLRELDRVTLHTLDTIQQRVKAVGLPTSIVFAQSGTSLLVQRPVSNSDWQRLRRQFIHLNRLYQVDVGQIEGLFVNFLGSNLI